MDVLINYIVKTNQFSCPDTKTITECIILDYIITIAALSSKSELLRFIVSKLKVIPLIMLSRILSETRFNFYV